VTIALFGGAYALCELGTIATEERALLFIMLATILIINAVWQATALALARLETLILPPYTTVGVYEVLTGPFRSLSSTVTLMGMESPDNCRRG
jgi:hypothetical protein